MALSVGQKRKLTPGPRSELQGLIRLSDPQLAGDEMASRRQAMDFSSSKGADLHQARGR